MTRKEKQREDLIRENERLVRQVRKRRSRLKKSGVYSPAEARLAEREKTFGKLRGGKNLSDEVMKRQIKEIKKFLEAKTGSLRGARAYRKQELKRLKEKGIDVSEEEFYSDWKDFLSTDLFKEYKKYDSERALMEGQKALRSGRTLEELNDLWKQYQQDKITMAEVWERWTNGKN